MADRYDPKLVVRPMGDRRSGEGRPAGDDDPLIELARLVSGRSPFDAAPGGRTKTVPASQSDIAAGGDASRDLESELLSDLQASFAALQQAVPAPSPVVRAALPRPAPPPRVEPRAERPQPVERPARPEEVAVAPPAAQAPPAPPPPAKSRLSIFRSTPRVNIAEIPLRPTIAATPQVAPPPATTSEARPTRWERQDEPRAAPPEASRFAPPRTPAHPHAEVAEVPAPVEEETYLDDVPPFAEETGEEFPLESLEPIPGYEDELPPFPDEELSAMTPRRSGRGLMFIAVLLAVVIVGGLGFILFRSGGTGTSPPPIIASDKTPTKIAPADTAANDTADHQNKLVYERVGTDTDTNGTNLVTPGKEAITDIPPVPGEGTNNAISRVIAPAGPGFDTPIDQNGDTTNTADSSTDGSSIGPKKVRTVVVRPDGTIVSSSATPADGGDTTAPADTTPPATDATTAPPPAATPPAVAKTTPPATNSDNYSDLPAVSKVGPTDNAPPADANAAAEPPKTAVTPPKKVAVKPPTPVLAPQHAVTPKPATGGPIDLTPPAGTAPALPAPTAASPAPIAASGVLVQLSSQRSEADATASFRSAQGKFPNILGGYQANIQRADLGDKGIYFRVRVGPFANSADAQQLCASLKAAGGQCILAH